MAVFNFTKARPDGTRTGWVRFQDNGRPAVMTFDVEPGKAPAREVTAAAATALKVIRDMNRRPGTAQVKRGGQN